MATVPTIKSPVYEELLSGLAPIFDRLALLPPEQLELIDTQFRDVCVTAGMDSTDTAQVWALAVGLLMASKVSGDTAEYVIRKAVAMVAANSQAV